jgi:hypothetical protein
MIIVERPLDLILLLTLILWGMVHHVRLRVGKVTLMGASNPGGYLDIRAREVKGVDIHGNWQVLVHRRPSTRRHVDDRVPASTNT